MNKTYRTVWSEARGTWIAASENSKSRGKASAQNLASIALAVIFAAGFIGSAGAQSIGSGIAGDTGTAISDTNCAVSGFSAANADATAVAIGCGAAASEGLSPPGTAIPYSNIAIGINAKAPPVLGVFLTPLRGSNIAIGGSASATGDGTQGGDQIAIGNESVAFGADSISIGGQTSARGFRSMVMGGNYSEADVASSNAIVLGIAATAVNAPNAIVMGNNSRALGANAIVIGTDSIIEVADGTALGNATRVANANSVAIGANSRALASQVAVSGATINGTAYSFAGAAPVGTVSFGSVGAERQLTQVAAGQVTQTSTDGVNGSQLFAAQQAIEGVAGDVNTLDGRVTNIFNTGTKYFHANSTGADSQAIGVNSVAIGQGAVSSHAGSVALGAGSNASGATLGSTAYTPTAGAPIAGTAPVGELSLGSAGQERRITNLAAGATDTDAVNVSQLRAVTAGATADSVKYDNSTHTTVTLNAGGASTTITNLAPGSISASSTDAVNGSQLFATNTNVANLGTFVANVDGRVSNIYDTGTKYFHANSTGADSQATGADSVAIGQGAVSSSAGSVALGAGSVADGSTLGNGAYLVGGAAAGEVNVGNRRITGVAAGSGDGDAANIAQLRRLHDESIRYELNTDGTINYNAVTLGGAGGTIIHNVAPGVAGTDAVNLNQLTAATITTANKWITGNPTAYAAPTAGATNSTAVGSGATSTGTNSVALGTNSSDGGRANVVSVGASGSERQITNVAAGTAGTDAVNVNQLRPFADALGGGTTINANGSITGPSYTITNVDSAGNTTNNSYNNVGDALGGLSNSVVNLNDAVHNINQGAGIKYFHANSTASDSVASGAESTAMGPTSSASGNSAVAAGDRATASGAGSVAVGQQSVASGPSSVAVGQGAQATNTGSVAIGLNSQSTGVNTIAIGTGAVATNSVAVGAGAQAGGGGAAFGDGAIAINTSKGTA
ncbi:MAG: hypothetical protein KKC79_15245, partial [Gammaproteobacteria bacterium]|nr:hypothetical protein [Gammaproteobacteria bacterium]